jgi:triacylglycerol lipase
MTPSSGRLAVVRAHGVSEPGRRRRPISRSAIDAARELGATAAGVWGAASGLAQDTARHAARAAGPRAGANRQDRPSPSHQSRAAAPVVLVHGFAASSASWFAVRRALLADGRTVVSFDYPPWASSVDELADRLAVTVEDVLAATGATRVHLVGHSLGGVIIALAMTRDRLAERVELVVTIGSPFTGSSWAWMLPLAPLVRALRPGSALLCRLAAAPTPASVHWLAFAATHDPIVPAHGAVPQNRRATRVMIAAAGHSGMLLHPEVVTRILAATSLRERAADLGAPLAACA